MAKIYVTPELGTKVQQLRHYFDVVTASDKGIIMLERDDWDKVCEYIRNFDDRFNVGDNDDGDVTGFLGDNSLWSICFFICCYNDDEGDSFWAVADHDMFLRVCRTCKVQPIVLETRYSIPRTLINNTYGVKPSFDNNFEIEVEDN